jgi:prevent-host-death family protein
MNITIGGTMTVQEVSAVRFRQNLGEMIARVQYGNETILVNKGGKPAAALVDPVLYGRIQRMWDNFETLTGRLSDAYVDVPEDEGMAEIESVSAAVRREGNA